MSLSFCLYVRYALSCVLGVGSGACFVIYVHVVKSELSEPSLTVDIHVFFQQALWFVLKPDCSFIMVPFKSTNQD